MNSFKHILTCVEELCFRPLHLSHKSFCKIFHHNSIRPCKESKDIFDEIAFIIIELFRPVLHIFGQINFFRSPENSHMLFVSFPNVWVTNGENYKAIIASLEKGFRKRTGCFLWGSICCDNRLCLSSSFLGRSMRTRWGS